MSRLAVIVGLSALALAGGVAFAQPMTPDQSAPPGGGDPNIENGAGGGPAGSIGDPNGVGPGAASATTGAPLSTIPPPAISRSDRKTLDACQAMSHEAMRATAKCKGLLARHPDLFNGDGTLKSPP